jgi:hypothetical protein
MATRVWHHKPATTTTGNCLSMVLYNNLVTMETKYNTPTWKITPMVCLTCCIIQFRLHWCTTYTAFIVRCLLHHLATAYATGTMGCRQQCVPAPPRRVTEVSMALFTMTEVCRDMTRCQLVNIYHKDWILPGIRERWLLNIYQWRPGCPEIHHVKWLNSSKLTQRHIPADISVHLKDVRYTIRSVRYTIRSVHNMKGYRCYQTNHEYVWCH